MVWNAYNIQRTCHVTSKASGQWWANSSWVLGESEVIHGVLTVQELAPLTPALFNGRLYLNLVGKKIFLISREYMVFKNLLYWRVHKLKFCLGCSWAKFLKDCCLGGWSGFGLVAEARKAFWVGRREKVWAQKLGDGELWVEPFMEISMKGKLGRD